MTETAQGSLLIVEDDRELGHLLDVGLSHLGWTVRRVVSAREARAVLAEWRPDAVLTELILPDADGRQFLAELRAVGPKHMVPLVVLDGSREGRLGREALLSGADQVVTKPLELEALHETLEGLVLRSRSLTRSTTRDPATGLLNRTGIRGQWDEMLNDGEQPPVVTLVELDGFRELTASLGWDQADQIRREAARRLEAILPSNTLLASWADDTFLILHRDRDEVTQPHQEIQEVLARFRDQPFTRGDGETFRLTFSAAIHAPQAGATLDQSLAAGSVLLQDAGLSGGNQVVSDQSGTQARSRTILLAEDDPLTAELLRHRLEREGYEIIHFSDGASAYEAALKTSVGLAIFDVKMPAMDGFELLERLRRIPAWQGIPVIMLTGMGREEDVVRGFSLGASDYVVKPFSPQEILARVQRFLP